MNTLDKLLDTLSDIGNDEELRLVYDKINSLTLEEKALFTKCLEDKESSIKHYTPYSLTRTMIDCFSKEEYLKEMKQYEVFTDSMELTIMCDILHDERLNNKLIAQLSNYDFYTQALATKAYLRCNYDILQHPLIKDKLTEQELCTIFWLIDSGFSIDSYSVDFLCKFRYFHVKYVNMLHDAGVKQADLLAEFADAYMFEYIIDASNMTGVPLKECFYCIFDKERKANRGILYDAELDILLLILQCEEIKAPKLTATYETRYDIYVDDFDLIVKMNDTLIRGNGSFMICLLHLLEHYLNHETLLILRRALDDYPISLNVIENIFKMASSPSVTMLDTYINLRLSPSHFCRIIELLDFSELETPNSFLIFKNIIYYNREEHGN